MTSIRPGWNRTLVMAAVVASMFVSSVEGTIVATAIPSIVAELGGFSLLGWVFGAFLLPMAVSVPIYGRLADLHGRKRVFIIGVGIFLLGSTLCGLAWNMTSLVAFRAIQGLGAGAIMPVTYTIVADIYSPTERARVQAWLSSVWGIAGIAGPALGAAIVEHLHWSIIFWINLPLGVLAMLLIALFLPERMETMPHRLDLAGAGLIAASAGTLMLALLQAAQFGWWIAPLLTASAAAAILFVRQERRTAEPMLPPLLWRNRAVVVGSIGNAVIGALLIGVIAYLPIYVQGVMQRSALAAGVSLALLSTAWPVTGSLSARLIVRVSYRRVATAGGIVLVVGASLLLLLTPDRGMTLLCVASTAIGMGFGLMSLTMLLAVQASVPWNARGIATSSVIFMRAVGQALGTAAMGAVLNLGLAYRLPGLADPAQTLMDPLRRENLPPADLAVISNAVAASLHEVYIGLFLLACLLLGVARAMPDRTLTDAAEHPAVDGRRATGQMTRSR